MTRLNLLPPEIRNEIALSKKNAKLRQFVYYSITAAIAMAVIYMLAIFYLYTQKIEFEKQKAVAQSQIADEEKTFLKAKDMYTRLELVKKIKKNSIDWIFVLNEVAKQTPGSVQIETFTTNQTDLRVKLTGFALNDKDAVTFKENLSKSELFNYVDIESITRSKDLNGRDVRTYVISFSLRAEKVKR